MRFLCRLWLKRQARGIKSLIHRGFGPEWFCFLKGSQHPRVAKASSPPKPIIMIPFSLFIMLFYALCLARFFFCSRFDSMMFHFYKDSLITSYFRDREEGTRVASGWLCGGTGSNPNAIGIVFPQGQGTQQSSVKDNLWLPFWKNTFFY